MDPAAANLVRAFSERLAGVLGVLCVPIRLEILVHLLEAPSDVSGLADHLELGITLVSHHLCVLRKAGLVECSFVKRQHRYAASPVVRLHRRAEGAVDPVGPDAALGPGRTEAVWLVVRMPGDGEARVLLPSALWGSLERSQGSSDGVRTPARGETGGPPSTSALGRATRESEVTIRLRPPESVPEKRAGKPGEPARPTEVRARCGGRRPHLKGASHMPNTRRNQHQRRLTIGERAHHSGSAPHLAVEVVAA